MTIRVKQWLLAAGLTCAFLFVAHLEAIDYANRSAPIEAGSSIDGSRP